MLAKCSRKYACRAIHDKRNSSCKTCSENLRKVDHWKLKKRTLKPQTCRTPMPSSVSRAPERQIVDQSRFQENHWRLKKRIPTPILKPKNATASPAETLHSVNTSYNPIRPGHKRSRTQSNITSQQAVVAPENAETPQSQASEDEVDHAHDTEPS